MSSFVAARFLRDRHRQTIYSALLRRVPPVPTKRERWELPDGDFLDVDLLAGQSGDDTPLVVILHGLEGSSKASYVRGLLAELHAVGLAAAAVNFRGCSGEINRHARFYHSGETGDLRHVIARLVAARPARKLAVVGYSLGGNMTLKYLGEAPAQLPAQIAGAAAVSVPYDLKDCAHSVDGRGPFTLLYRARFMRRLCRKALAKSLDYPQHFNAAAIKRLKTFAEFDKLITAPMFKFADAEDYWNRSSAKHFVSHIRVPTLLIQAADDPLVPLRSVPEPAIKANANLHLELSATGGHVGFVGGTILKPAFYAERRIVQFLRERFA